MLQICGCAIPAGDAAALLRLLDEDVTLASDEAAAAIRYAMDGDRPIDAVDPDIRVAILHVLDVPPTADLAALREVLEIRQS